MSYSYIINQFFPKITRFLKMTPINSRILIFLRTILIFFKLYIFSYHINHWFFLDILLFILCQMKVIFSYIDKSKKYHQIFFGQKIYFGITVHSILLHMLNIYLGKIMIILIINSKYFLLQLSTFGHISLYHDHSAWLNCGQDI